MQSVRPFPVRGLRLLAGLFVVLAALIAPASLAHEIRPAIVDFNLTGEDGYEFVIQANVEALLAGIGSAHDDTSESVNSNEYDRLRQLPPDALKARFAGFSDSFMRSVEVRFDGEPAPEPDLRLYVPEVGDTFLVRESRIILSGTLPTGATYLTWAWPEAYGASVLRVNTITGDAEEGYSAYLSAGERSEPVLIRDARPRGFLEVAWEYLSVGFTHILPKGLDHILFVIGLFLLSTKFAALLWQVTAFTVAHTVTLALGILGYVSISPAIVEPLIALSIVYVAVENIMTDRLQRWRPVIVFGFGLLHGLGFAGVLEEIGVSEGQFVTGLIAFNVGVELGQLAVIALCFLAVGIWFGTKKWYRQVVTIPASVLIALVAGWWVYERVFLT